MTKYDDFQEPPIHVDRVNTEIVGMFKYIGYDRPRMESLFQTSFDAIDLGLAWTEFDKIAYDTMFKETNGDLEFLYDPVTRGRIQAKILSRWPLSYYIKLLTSAGIMNVVDSQGSDLYFFKESYKPSINSLVNAESIKSGS